MIQPQCAADPYCFDENFVCEGCCSTGLAKNGKNCWDKEFTKERCCYQEAESAHESELACGHRNELDRLKHVDLDQALRGDYYQHLEKSDKIWADEVLRIKAQIAEIEKLANKSTIDPITTEMNYEYCKWRCQDWNTNNKHNDKEVCVAFSWNGASQDDNCIKHNKKCQPSGNIDTQFNQWYTEDMDPIEFCRHVANKGLCEDEMHAQGNACAGYCNTKKMRGKIPTYSLVRAAPPEKSPKTEGCVNSFNSLHDCKNGPFYSDTDPLELATHTSEHECETQCNDNCDCKGYTYYTRGDKRGKNCVLLKYDENNLNMKNSFGSDFETVTKIQDKGDHNWCPECQCDNEGRKLGATGGDWCTLVQGACKHPDTGIENKKDHEGKFEKTVTCKNTNICPKFDIPQCCDDIVAYCTPELLNGTYGPQWECGSQWANQYCHTSCGRINIAKNKYSCMPRNLARPDMELLPAIC